MLSKYSSNVVLAKARAMYGKRIRATDFDALLNCKSVFEIASFLKNNTAYSKVLSVVNESEVHRAELELVIRNKIFDDLDILLRYEIAAGDAFSNYLIAKAEVEQIIHALHRVVAVTSDGSKPPVPAHFIQRTKINLRMLSNARSFDELLGALNNSSYKKLLKNISTNDDGVLNLSEVECILYNYVYEILFKSADKIFDKSAKKQLVSIFKAHIDFSNFVRIVRSKRNFKKSYSFMVLSNGAISKSSLEAMIKAATEAEAFEIMKSIPQGHLLNKLEYNYIDQIPSIVLYRKCKREIYSSTNASVVLIAYIFLMENELSNIIKIIEGIRYSLPKDEIAQLLTL